MPFDFRSQLISPKVRVLPQVDHEFMTARTSWLMCFQTISKIITVNTRLKKYSLIKVVKVTFYSNKNQKTNTSVCENARPV